MILKIDIERQYFTWRNMNLKNYDSLTRKENSGEV